MIIFAHGKPTHSGAKSSVLSRSASRNIEYQLFISYYHGYFPYRTHRHRGTLLDEAIPFYENILGLKCFAIEEVADQKVRTAFFQVGQTKIELLEGTAEDSAISKFIANNGGRGGIQHVAFAVADGVANALAEAEEKGCRLIDKAPRKGAEGLNIAFLHPKSTVGTLVELCEDPKKN